MRLLAFLMTAEGRIGRLAYLGGWLLNAVIVFLGWFIGLALGKGVGVALLFGIPASLLAVYVSVTLSIRRLHDMDLSGWHYLWIVGLSVVGAMVGNVSPGSVPDIVFTIVTIAVAGWMLLMPGTKGANRFGYDFG